MTQKGSRSKYYFNEKMEPTKLRNSKGVIHQPSTKCLDTVLGANSDDYIEFLKRCLEWDPCKRMTPNEALNHYWLAD
jgi:dual specificity tyrosine-phosphorylation-regulated kinase 2/3/4